MERIRSPLGIVAVIGFVVLAAGIFGIVKLPFNSGESQNATAEFTGEFAVYDNNYHPLLSGYLSLEGNGQKISYSINNGRVSTGWLPKGNYAMKIWLGTLDRKDHLLYSSIFTLNHDQENISILLLNVTQKIQVFAADQGTEIPMSPEEEVVRIQRYQPENVSSVWRIKPKVVNGVDCSKYLLDEWFYKSAAASYRSERQDPDSFVNTQWFAQKARDARMDYELCLAGVPLRDYN